jgi:hypothetical protein
VGTYIDIIELKSMVVESSLLEWWGGILRYISARDFRALSASGKIA